MSMVRTVADLVLHYGRHQNVGKKGRIASLALGALFAAFGSRGGNSRRLFLPAGLGLLRRGATGYCPVFNRLHINTAEKKKAS